jgi:hypothetical protein
MHTLDKSGDQKVMWDKDVTAEVEAARETFDRLTGQGYLAYKAEGRKGNQGEQIRRFDPDAERIILVRPHAGG